MAGCCDASLPTFAFANANWRLAIPRHYGASPRKGTGVPETACEVTMDLINQLASRARVVGLIAGRLHEIVAFDRDARWAQTSQAIKPLRSELAASMKEWERLNRELQNHKTSHGC